MIIGIIGATSNIASKAYLPVYAALQDEHRFILYSRNWNKAEEVRKKYKFEYATTDLTALETVDLVIIHAATSSHFELAKRYLAAGVHVLMDKPISENYEEVKTLYQLAEAHQVLFVIAFNRRFAPQTQKLKAIPHKNYIKITKNLAQHNGNLTFQLYDIFSHPLDTLVYLLDDEIKTHHAHIKLDAKGQLERAVVYLETETSMGIASMNLDSGAYRETFEVEAKGQTAIVSDLSELTSFTGIDQIKSVLSGWSSATYTRGFDAIVLCVLEAINQYTPEKRELLMENLKQKNVMTTHEIIAGMLDSL